MRSWIRSILLATAVAIAPAAALAAELQVSPTGIDVAAPGAASKISITNLGKDVINAQVRIFKWVQVDGENQLLPTRDVVASPPAMKIQAGRKATIRIVRLTKAPATAEESYRLIVDEIPPPPRSAKAAVALTVRHNLPVFFGPRGGASDLSWRATVNKGQLRIVANNAGSRHSKLSELAVVSSTGKQITIAHGLAGYVLSGASNQWRAKAKSIAVGSTIKIVAKGTDGPVEAIVQVQAAN